MRLIYPFSWSSHRGQPQGVGGQPGVVSDAQVPGIVCIAGFDLRRFMFLRFNCHRKLELLSQIKVIHYTPYGQRVSFYTALHIAKFTLNFV